jgi:anti-sigma regulatory factor (Ser/Thr protein kinase)
MATEPSSQFEMRAKLEQLQDLKQWVDRLAADFCLPAALVQRIDLCLTELVTNVVSYGYPDGRVGAVKVRFRSESGQVVIHIEDDGVPFDPTSYASPGLPSALADAPDGGRGIRLVRHFSDELHHSAGGAGNQLTLVFRDAGIDTHRRAAGS